MFICKRKQECTNCPDKKKKHYSLFFFSAKHCLLVLYISQQICSCLMQTCCSSVPQQTVVPCDCIRERNCATIHFTICEFTASVNNTSTQLPVVIRDPSQVQEPMCLVTDDPLVLLEESLLDVSVRCCSSNMYGWSWVYIRPPMESTISKRTARTLSAVPRKYSLRTAGTMITGLRQKPIKQEEERWSG